MLIRESTIRQIIKDELRRALREADDAAGPEVQIQLPQVGSLDLGGPVTAAVKSPTSAADQASAPVSVNQAAQASYRRTMDPTSAFRAKMSYLWVSFIKQLPSDSQTTVSFQFTLGTDGKAAPGTTKVTCTPDYTAKYGPGLPTTKLSTEIKKLIEAEVWPRPTESFQYVQPKPLQLGVSEG